MSKYDFAKHHNAYLNDYIKFADAKALAIITVNGLIIRVLFEYLKDDTFKVTYFITLISCIVLIMGIFFAARVIFPRTTDKNTKGLIFWENVSAMEKEEYINQVIEIDDKTLLDKMIEQNYFLSKTATKKYRVLKKAFILTFIGFIGLTIAGFIWILVFGK